jgi:hypothetical protein
VEIGHSETFVEARLAMQQYNHWEERRGTMRLLLPTSLVVFAVCESLFGQDAAPAPQPQTFHVRGTITDPSGAVIPGAKVKFQKEHVKTTVLTSGAGVYEADLPLGDYTMAAEVAGFRPFRRPLFRVGERINLTFNVVLPVASTCDPVIIGPATGQDWAAARELCLHEDFFQAPSTDGIPYQVYIRYVKRSAVGDSHSYASAKFPVEDRVFLAYNLFSLQADTVSYDEKSRIVEASGNVVVEDESGTSRPADNASFRMVEGRAERR